MITWDLICGHCGYNLRGLYEEGRCPECGSPVSNSLNRRFLADSDPRWVARIRSSLRRIPAASVFWAVLIFACWACSSPSRPDLQPLVISALLGPRPLGAGIALVGGRNGMPAPSVIVLAPAAAFFLWQFWRLGESEPGEFRPADVSGIVLRSAVVLYAVFFVFIASLAVQGRRMSTAHESRILVPIAFAVDAALVGAFHVRQRKLAARIANPGLRGLAMALLIIWVSIDAIEGFRSLIGDYSPGIACLELLVAAAALPVSFAFKITFNKVWSEAAEARGAWQPAAGNPPSSPSSGSTGHAASEAPQNSAT